MPLYALCIANEIIRIAEVISTLLWSIGPVMTSNGPTKGHRCGVSMNSIQFNSIQFTAFKERVKSQPRGGTQQTSQNKTSQNSN